ncbi:MAG TPA: DUF1176 domain-containing protein [Blastocatellia bacterium]|nr:DUF1176 domain-containing protein [Blastocatellia bacterium]
MTSNRFKPSNIKLLALFVLLSLSGCAARGDLQPQANRAAPQPSPAASQPPAESARAAPPLKKTGLTYEDRKSWREALKWPDECEQAFDYPDKSLAGIEANRLAEGRYLVAVTCTLGAYQGYQLYYLYDETKPEPAAKLLTFESRESQEDDSLTATQTTEVWGQPTFDEKTKELKVLNRFRGVGDCGFLATYEFVDGEPKLKELRAKPACDGKDGGGPEKWRKVVPR